jgi:hypothetical protein
MGHDGAETDATRGDLRPSANHPRPILRPNYVPKFASKPLTFIVRSRSTAGPVGDASLYAKVAVNGIPTSEWRQ